MHQLKEKMIQRKYRNLYKSMKQARIHRQKEIKLLKYKRKLNERKQYEEKKAAARAQRMAAMMWLFFQFIKFNDVWICSQLICTTSTSRDAEDSRRGIGCTLESRLLFSSGIVSNNLTMFDDVLDSNLIRAGL